MPRGDSGAASLMGTGMGRPLLVWCRLDSSMCCEGNGAGMLLVLFPVSRICSEHLKHCGTLSP